MHGLVEIRSQFSAANTSTLADQLVDALAELGISDYFGVPGGSIEPLFNALAREQRRGRVRVVSMRSEAGAAFAADGFYRATGRIAACTATAGPGTTNLITAVMSAHADRIPMLVLTPQVTSSKQGRGALQDSSSDGYDLEQMLAKCCRYSTIVTHAEQLPHKLARALSMTRTAPRGPVHLSLPADLLAQKLPSLLARPLRHGVRREVIDEAALRKMLERLARASSPVFYVGDDGGKSAERTLLVAQSLGATVVSSPAGKRWLSHTNPVYRGVLGFSGHATATRAIASADLVVALGATFDELSTNAWLALPARTPIFSVDEHDAHAYRLPDALPVVSSVARALEEIEACASYGARAQPVLSQPPPWALQGSESGRVHPADLMGWLGQRLGSKVVVHVDAGNGFSWSTRYLTRSRGDTYRVAMGVSSMGWALGAAIGAALGDPRRTVCVVGDGSMLMSGLDLTVAAERKLPITYVVLNDSSLGMVRHGQLLSGGESIAHQIPPVRFDLLARACGVRGVRVRRFKDLERVPTKWLTSDDGGPALLDVQIDPTAVPPMAERVSALARGLPR